jgi:HlyD family secretion protein
MKTTGTPAVAETMMPGGLRLSGPRKLWWRWLFLLALLAALLLVIWRWKSGSVSQEVQYKTVAARRGDLTVLVTATGNLEPTNQLLVGIEVSGTIKSVAVDNNDFVKAGQVLARLDTTKLEAQARQAEAVLETARARLLQAESSLFVAGQEMKRFRQIRTASDGRLPSAIEFEKAEATLKRAEADKAMGEATIAEAKARLQVNKTDLVKAMVLSPIDGVVLKRTVEPGQTVAASFQSPQLFTLAEDLTKMELQVNVDEADVGKVQSGQAATFTVDAYPDRTFPARITQVRYGSEVNAGVVTYRTILDVENSDLALRPGMTATADIVVQKIGNALLVPVAALRFSPSQQKDKGKGKEDGSSGGSLLNKLFPRRIAPKKIVRNTNDNKGQQQVWVLRDNQPVAVPVTIGATNGTMMEILSGEIAVESELIVEAVSKKRP